MSAIVPVKFEDAGMMNPDIIWRMLDARLRYKYEEGSRVSGWLGSSWGYSKFVEYDRANNAWKMDEDLNKDDTQDLLKHYYKIETVKVSAESFGLDFSEVMDASTGMIKSCSVDGDMSQYSQLLTEVA